MGQFLPQLLPTNLYIILLIITFCLLVYVFKFKIKQKNIILFICVYLLGFSYIGIMAQHRTNLQPNIQNNTTSNITGCIVSIITEDKIKKSFLLKTGKINNKNIKIKIKLSDYSDNQYQSGKCYKLQAKIKKPHGMYNPGGFDYEAYLLSSNITLTGYIKKQIKIKEDNFNYFHFIRGIFFQQIKNNTNNLLFADVLQALILGERGQISSSHNSIFTNTGTSHLIAISGLHIGLVAGFGMFVGILIWLILPIHHKISKQVFSLIFALLVAVIYAIMAGLSLPTIRAILMLIVFAFSIFLKRHSSPWNTLSVALLLVLLIDPFAPMQVGFWLSFIAVAFIIYFYPKISSFKKHYQFLIFTPSISIALILPILFFFGQASAISPLANIIAVPIISFLVLPLSLIAALLSFVMPVVSICLLKITDLLLYYLFWYLEKLSSFSFSQLYLDNITTLQIIIAGIMLLLIFKQHYKSSFFAFAICITLIFINYDKLQQSEFEVTVLDVGQGLSIVVRTQNKLLVFDTGERFSEKFNIVEGILIPYLMHTRTKKLDALIVSHSDSDHSSNIKELLYKYNSYNRWAGQIDDDKIIKIGSFKQCKRGVQWQWDGVDFSFLSPEDNKISKKDNNQSCVLRISNKNNSILISSDIEKEIEKHLIRSEKNKSLSADILIVPHHGSKTSSTTNFLKTVNPQYAIVSAGYKNKFKHPAKTIQQRYKKLKIPLLNTAHLGAISIIFKKKITIKTHRFDYPRYWHSKK